MKTPRRNDPDSGWSGNAPDAEFALSCPTCGRPLEYLTTVMYLPHHPQTSVVPREDAHYYRCPDHGRFSFTKADGLKPEPT